VLIRYVTFYVFYLSMLRVVKIKLIYGRCCWGHNLANTIEPSVCGGDAA